MTGSDTAVGPPLAGFAQRSTIAGHAPNTRRHLVDWIREPQRLRPGSAMPDVGVSAADAEDIAAYLESLR